MCCADVSNSNETVQSPMVRPVRATTAALEGIAAFMLVRKNESHTLIFDFSQKSNRFSLIFSCKKFPFSKFSLTLQEIINHNFRTVKLRISPYVNYVQYKNRYAVRMKHVISTDEDVEYKGGTLSSFGKRVTTQRYYLMNHYYC